MRNNLLRRSQWPVRHGVFGGRRNSPLATRATCTTRDCLRMDDRRGIAARSARIVAASGSLREKSVAGVPVLPWRKSIVFEDGVHLHILYFAVFNGIASQDALTVESRFFEYAAGRGVASKGFRVNPDDIASVKDVLACLFYRFGHDSLSPVLFCEVVPQFGRSFVYVSLSKSANAPNRLIVHGDGERKRIVFFR